MWTEATKSISFFCIFGICARWRTSTALLIKERRQQMKTVSDYEVRTIPRTGLERRYQSPPHSVLLAED
jgi:hypothetical protein